MVNLKEISPAELYEALERKDDGKTFVELVKAKAMLQETVLSAQEKAGQKILEFMREYFAEKQEYYQERFRENWWEAMKQDEIEHYLLEDKDLAKLVFEYMTLTLE